MKIEPIKLIVVHIIGYIYLVACIAIWFPPLFTRYTGGEPNYETAVIGTQIATALAVIACIVAIASVKVTTEK